MSKYQLSVTTGFSGAHWLEGYDGPCARMHGHNFKVEAKVSGRQLDKIGMLIDFKVIKRRLQEICDALDHQVANEIPPFDAMNPTAENMARHFYEMLAPVIEEHGAILDSISIWETDRYGVTYSPAE